MKLVAGKGCWKTYQVPDKEGPPAVERSAWLSLSNWNSEALALIWELGVTQNVGFGRRSQMQISKCQD